MSMMAAYSSSLHHRAGPSSEPDMPSASPSRRSTRRRSPPQFYTPPPTRGRRGRPPKSRVTSQLSCQEIRKRPRGRPRKAKEQSNLHKDDEVGIQSWQSKSFTLHDHLVGQATNTRGGICSHNVEKRDSDSDISMIGPPGPVNENISVKNVGVDNKTSQDINSKILQSVKNASQYMSGSQTSEDQTKRMLKFIYAKHGDIMQNCTLSSDLMKNHVLSGICEVVQDLKKRQLKDLASGSLESYYKAISDAENMKVGVLWLRKRLDEIKDAIELVEEVKGLEDEKCRLLENIEKKKKEVSLLDEEMERLKSRRQDAVDQVVESAVMVEELTRRIDAQTSKCTQFHCAYLMDGLI